MTAALSSELSIEQSLISVDCVPRLFLSLVERACSWNKAMWPQQTKLMLPFWLATWLLFLHEVAPPISHSLQHRWCMRPGIDQSTSCMWVTSHNMQMHAVCLFLQWCSKFVCVCIPQFHSCFQALPSFLSLAVTHTNEANTFCQSTHSHRSYPDSWFCLHGCNKNTVLGLSDCPRSPQDNTLYSSPPCPHHQTPNPMLSYKKFF